MAAGSWAAHGLPDHLAGLYGTQRVEVGGESIKSAVKYAGDFRTGSSYQLTAALGMLAVSTWRGRRASMGRWLLLIGSFVFSGCLYTLVLTEQKWLGAVVPIGGVLMLSGWGCLAAAALEHSRCERRREVLETR